MNARKSILLASLIVSASAFTTTAANAADGCKFVLCMGAANPTGIKECASTVREVLRDMRKGKGLPTCKLVDGRTAQVTAKAAPSNPECPSGWKQLPDKKNAGATGANYFVQGRPTADNLKFNSVSHRFGAGQNGLVGANYFDYDIVDGKQVYDGYSSITCARGEHYHTLTDSYNRTYYFVEETKRVNKNENGFDFTLFINGQPQNTHRFN